MYVHTHTHTRTHARTHTHSHTHTDTYTRTYIHTCNSPPKARITRRPCTKNLPTLLAPLKGPVSAATRSICRAPVRRRSHFSQVLPFLRVRGLSMATLIWGDSSKRTSSGMAQKRSQRSL